MLTESDSVTLMIFSSGLNVHVDPFDWLMKSTAHHPHLRRVDPAVPLLLLSWLL